jgi:Tol biopolymer transport system component
MPLAPGTRLGPYQVTAQIGAGGMGEVYKAHDTRLDRSVAIKVLPPEFSADPERRARFEREAKTIAGLNHPHICTLHDVGERDGSTFLVMEHLQGETLAERLAKSPLPLEQALTVATEIADALAAAHRQGVIHRDLKPGNVMLTKAGAKLLDFGLAKLKGHGERPAAAQLASVPTQSTPLTGEGVILGTLQYMAPEQLEGKSADARTDLWALGAVLYEMLTGKRPFEGTSPASLIGNIMNAEPPALTTIQPLTPVGVDRLVRKCLAKDPEDRWDSAHDIADELRWLREMSGVPALTGVAPRRRRVVRNVLLVAGGLVMGTMAAVAAMWLLRPTARLAGLGLSVSPADQLNAGGEGQTLLTTPGGSRTALTWTSDGQALIFVGRKGGIQQLYLRPLNTDQARSIPNTEGAQVPAVSPDGQWVAFWADGAIRKVALGGSAAMVLASGVPSPPWGLVWDAAGAVYFGGSGLPIRQLSPEGTVSVVTTVGDAERSHGLPWPLPGGRVLLYTVRKSSASWGDEEIVAETLADGTRKVLLKNAADARYLPTGHLVFLRRGALYAVRFDPERLQLRGVEVPVLDGVAQALTGRHANDLTGAGQFAVAATGALAWLAGAVTPYPDGTLVTVDRHGQISPLPFEARSYISTLRVSPDGRRVAVPIMSLDAISLWLGDLGRGRLIPRVVDGECAWPIWSPDGRQVAFRWLKDGRYSLAAQSADGTTPPQVLVRGLLVPSSFTPDGRQIAAAVPVVGGDILMVSAENGQTTPQPLLQSPRNERWPEFSPDGQWLAYGSDVSRKFEVWVTPYPGPGEAVSIDEGESPAWAQNGRELLYLSLPDPAGRRRMMAVDFAPGSPRPTVGRPRLLFEFDPRELGFACNPVRCYDVTPDGQRFYVVQTPTPPPAPVVTHINLIQNWFEVLKAKVRPGK